MNKILITGVAGFTGNLIASKISKENEDFQIIGIDNFCRRGSEQNISLLKQNRITLLHGDIRSQSDIDTLPTVDWIIDCAANPSVLAGVDGQASSRQVMEHNLLGTINLLEYCKKHKAGLTILSTSRVYSAEELANISVRKSKDRYQFQSSEVLGISELGISEKFPTTAPYLAVRCIKVSIRTINFRVF